MHYMHLVSSMQILSISSFDAQLTCSTIRKATSSQVVKLRLCKDLFSAAQASPSATQVHAIPESDPGYFSTDVR